MEKQVNKDHYNFNGYMSIARWGSLWHQMRVVASLDVQKILEIGPGPGLFKLLVGNIGYHVETVDLDPDLKPDHVASATELPVDSGSFDLACAFQVLEHMPFEIALSALDEMARVSSKYVVISLPDSRRTWRYLAHLPRLGERNILVPRPQVSVPSHQFDGEHYWEIGKRGFDLGAVISAFHASKRVELTRTFRPFENPYHRFFIFRVMPHGPV